MVKLEYAPDFSFKSAVPCFAVRPRRIGCPYCEATADPLTSSLGCDGQTSFVGPAARDCGELGIEVELLADFVTPVANQSYLRLPTGLDIVAAVGTNGAAYEECGMELITPILALMCVVLVVLLWREAYRPNAAGRARLF